MSLKDEGSYTEPGRRWPSSKPPLLAHMQLVHSLVNTREGGGFSYTSGGMLVSCLPGSSVPGRSHHPSSSLWESHLCEVVPMHAMGTKANVVYRDLGENGA